jgi:hypothetical protein
MSIEVHVPFIDLNQLSYVFLVEVSLNLVDTEAMLIAIGISYADAHTVVAHIKETDERIKLVSLQGLSLHQLNMMPLK